MKKILITIITIILFSSFTFAIETFEDPAIQNFQVQDALGNIRTLQSQIENITQQLFSLDEQEEINNEFSQDYLNMRNELVNIINTIQASSQDIEQRTRRVATYKQSIDKALENLKSLREESDKTKGYIQDFSVFLFKTKNQILGKDGNIDDIKLLLYTDNIPLTLSNIQTMEELIKQFNTLLERLKESENKHIQTVKKLNDLRATASQDIKLYHQEMQNIRQKKEYLTEFLQLYKDGFVIENTLGLFEDKKSVHEATLQLVDQIQKQNYQVPFNIFDKLNELKNINGGKHSHIIARPIYPIQEILTAFEDRAFRQQNGFPHRGIQIKATHGTPVYSTRDAIVYHVTDNSDIGINWILLLHTDGYISTYTYINNIVVQAGDIVRRGQLLGYSGGEPGTRGAGFISPGPSLSFSIFQNGIAIDPLKLLDISVVEDRSSLPSTYAIKYLRDKYARNIDISTLKTMTGNTVDERAESFVNTYGVGVYRSLSFWDNAVVDTNIDRDMVICVAFAESTLGRYLSTSNNIGNVGNNDRGDRFAFGSALAGARAIAQTLNNQFLGDYHTIDQLSRYGNEDGSIYASSPINRQTNVLKCLSQIKGYYIPEDFPFRTGVNPNRLAEQAIQRGGFDREQVRSGNSN